MLFYIGGKMRLRVLFVIVAVFVALMATESFAADTCYVTPDTCHVCWTQELIPANNYITELDFGVCDTVRVGCPIRIPTVVPGDSIMVPIYVWNDEEIGGFTLGFKFDGTSLEIAKKTYDTTGTIIPGAGAGYMGEVVGDAMPGQYLFGWYDLPDDDDVLHPIPVNTTDKAKLLVMLKFKIKATATSGHIMIDSAFCPPAGPFILSTTDGIRLRPQFVHCPQGDIVLGDTPCGDVDGSSDINIADIVYMVNYIFRYGAPPQDPRGGDVDCDLRVTIADVVYLINYMFKAGPKPCLGCE